MIAITHQMFGLTFGLIAILFLQLFRFTPSGWLDTILFLTLVLFGSLLPDLDTPHSKLGRKFWPISFVISLFVKHRTATHSLLFLGIVLVISGIVCFSLRLSFIYTLAIGIGTFSHLLGDWLTKSGVPFLYPFKKDRFKAPFTFKTNSFKEKMLCLALIGFNILLFLLYSSSPWLLN